MSAPAVVAGRPIVRIRGTGEYPVSSPTGCGIRRRLHLAADRLAPGVRADGVRVPALTAQILVSLLTCAVLEVANRPPGASRCSCGRRAPCLRETASPSSCVFPGRSTGIGGACTAGGSSRHRRRRAAIEVRDRPPRAARFQPLEHRPRPLLPVARAGARPTCWTSGGGRCRPGWRSRSAIIVVGGLAILSRLRLLEIAVFFWIAFAAGMAVLAASGHAMTARWHLGPVSGWEFWRVLVFSPEILVFLFS